MNQKKTKVFFFNNNLNKWFTLSFKMDYTLHVASVAKINVNPLTQISKKSHLCCEPSHFTSASTGIPFTFSCSRICLTKTFDCNPVLIPAQERQLQSHSGMLESFRTDLSYLQKNPPEGKKAKAKDLEEHRTRAEYLHHEVVKVL